MTDWWAVMPADVESIVLVTQADLASPRTGNHGLSVRGWWATDRRGSIFD